MGCGCGGQKKTLNKPAIQRPAPTPRSVQPPAPVPPVPAVTHGDQVVQLQAAPAVLDIPIGNAPAETEQTIPVVLPPPPRPVPSPRPLVSSNAEAVREALRRRREQMAASRIGNRPRQY